MRKDVAQTAVMRRGFTLAELLIVVLIIGILATVAVPRFSASLAKRQVASLSRQLVMDIETVRQVARASSTAKSITIDSSARTYSLNGITNPNRRNASWIVALSDLAPAARFGTVNLGGDSVLAFNGFGCPDSSGTIQIVVGSTSTNVVIDAATGSATIQ